MLLRVFFGSGEPRLICRGFKCALHVITMHCTINFHPRQLTYTADGQSTLYIKLPFPLTVVLTEARHAIDRSTAQPLNRQTRYTLEILFSLETFIPTNMGDIGRMRGPREKVFTIR